MSIKEAIADFKKAVSEPTRLPVYMLGQHVGSCTHYAMTVEEDDCLPYVLFYAFYPNAPAGIFPIGDIVVDYEEGLVYMFDGGEGDIIIDYTRPVNLIEAIAKEL